MVVGWAVPTIFSELPRAETQGRRGRDSLSDGACPKRWRYLPQITPIHADFRKRSTYLSASRRRRLLQIPSVSVSLQICDNLCNLWINPSETQAKNSSTDYTDFTDSDLLKSVLIGEICG